MKKNIKRILIVLLTVVVVLAAAIFIYSYPMLSMSPTETGEFSGADIYAIKDTLVTVYFIKTETGYILVDAGTNQNNLLSSLEESEIDAVDVKWLLLTHSDSDHVAALASFPNAEIYMNEDELKMLDGTEKRSFLGGNSLPSSIDIADIKLLQDDQRLSFGGTDVRCIKAAGHTAGSMAYLIDGSYLFTGDAFSIRNGRLGVHPFTMDKNRAIETIDNLRELVNNSYVVMSAHYGSFVDQIFE